MSRRRPTPLGVFAAATLAAGAAAAQGRATDGVRLPTADVAALDRAEALGVNPAGIGFLEGAELTYVFTGTAEDARDEGHGFFTAFDVFGGYHTGVGIELLQQPGDQDHEPVRVTWGHALRLSPALSIGFSWHRFVADEDALLDDLDTFDFGLQARPWRWVAAGAAVTDFTTPEAGGGTIDRGYELGLAVRPGTEAVTLTGVARLPEDDGDPVWGGRVAIDLPGPFAFVGRYDTTTVGADDRRVHAFMAGFTDQVAPRLAAGAFAYVPDAGAGDVRAGFSALARVSSVARPEPPLLGRDYVVEVAIAGDLAEVGWAGFFAAEPRTPFLDLLRTLRAVGRRDDVAAVLLSFADPDIGWAQATELRETISELRAAGKRVYAHFTVADTRVYTVAAAADEIYVAPAGGVFLTGLSSTLTYLAELLERIGIDAQFVAIGPFKTAPEFFTRRAPSEPAARVMDSLLDGLFERVVRHIAEARGLKPERVRALIDRAPYTAADAEERGLVDGVRHYDEMVEPIRADLGPRFRFIEAGELLRVADERWGRPPRIAVLYAVGTITDGESVMNPLTGAATVGADTFVRAVRALREDPSVKAVVLRIDSPGGSVTAADLMWRELTLLAEAKPLIASMGNVAASGGYYIAPPAVEILASPETITGSIGVFTGKFDLSGLYWLLGVNRVLFLRGEHADFFSETRPWTEEELRIVHDGMERLYDLFVERVAAGRPGLEPEQVDAVGRGRVWTGAQARACGLVDRPAGLLTAIDLAALKAGLGDGDYEIAVYPRVSGFGGLPRAPVHALDGVRERLRALRGEAHRPGVPAADALPELIRPLLDLPLLHFRSGQALALLPFLPPR